MQTKEKEKESFVKHLLSIGSFTQNAWLINPHRPGSNTIIEYDEINCHGFDKVEDYTLDQIQTLTNDFIINSFAIDNQLNLIRIKSDSNWQQCKNLDDLRLIAYYIVDNGKVIKEGTFKLSDKQKLISREKLIKINNPLLYPEAKGKIYTKETILPILINFLRAHVGYWGWFYPPLEDDITSEFQKLQIIQPANNIISTLPAFSTLLKSIIRSYWDVDDGPMKSFNNDIKLRAVLSYRLGLNNSKMYKYKVDNKLIECNETFDINFKNIRKGFIVQRHAVSWFKPAAAASIYKKFLQNNINPIIWDPSIGFSARMSGFIVSYPQGKYIGSDPSRSVCDDAINISKTYLNSINADIRCEGSEKTKIEDLSLDFVFTSPPYFDKEKYLNEDGQCWKDYPTIELWIKNYLLPTFKTAYEGLKNNCYMVINVDDELSDIIITSAKYVGFTYCEHMNVIMPIKKDHFSRKHGHNKLSSETFFVFIKIFK
jgi:hypothetical protein